MAIIQVLLAFLTRSAGKILNAAFGWATVMLFGQVPQERRIYLSLIAFGSVAWIVALAGVLEPSVATFLYQTFGRAVPFIADAVTYAVSLATLVAIKARFQSDTASVKHDLRAEIADGLRWLWVNQASRTTTFPNAVTTNWGSSYPESFAALIVAPPDGDLVCGWRPATRRVRGETEACHLARRWCARPKTVRCKLP